MSKRGQDLITLIAAVEIMLAVAPVLALIGYALGRIPYAGPMLGVAGLTLLTAFTTIQAMDAKSFYGRLLWGAAAAMTAIWVEIVF